MLEINLSDVIGVIQSCIPNLIFFGIVLIAMILLIVFSRKKEIALKSLLRKEAVAVILLALVITLDTICLGPLSTLITLATGNGVITEESNQEAETLCNEIAEEGIVLLKNENNTLPLKDQKNLNIFGWSSTNPVYGGTGSGALSEAYPMVSLIEGIENAGFSVNKELETFYTDYRSERPVIGPFGQDWSLPEPTVSMYTDEMLQNAKDFSDTALFVVSRSGAEAADLPKDMNNLATDRMSFEDNSTEYTDFPEGSHYLELSQSELKLLHYVCDNFDNVIFVINSANVMELGVLNDYPQVKSVLFVPGMGQTGFNGLGEILSGAVNPSGKTSDIFTADFTTSPSFNNFQSNQYTNMAEFAVDLEENFRSPHTEPNFVNYNEGIYVGYKFYETAAEEGLINYDDEVVYPFGYGLSYTTFTQEMSELSTDADGNITFDVTVTNTGDTAGKDVVEVYYNPPYYNNSIEKASANLVNFEKTKLLEPGESETLTITFNEDDMASFDTYNTGYYVLENGDYGISIRSDSHTILDEKVYHVDSDIVYNDTNPRTGDVTTAEVKLADNEGEVTYLSRKDGFANYAEATAAPSSYEISDKLKAMFVNNATYNPEDDDNPEDVMPTLGANNGISLVELRGADYDDPRWDTLLDQMTVDDMQKLLSLGGFQTQAIASVGKVATTDCDGPASINNNFTGVGSSGMPSGVVIACTWSHELAKQFGEIIGKMADEMGVSGWYAPAMNIHRSPFGGRTFEYYSEDGYLSGEIAAQAILGAKEYGVYAYIKHFALNEMEQGRQKMICTWANEQSVREIYLKPFEISVKKGGANAVMSSYNYIGAKWAGAHGEILNGILRNEWGFHGMVLTDAFWVQGLGYMNADQAVRNGNDIILVNYDAVTNTITHTDSATTVQAMRTASKNVMYTVVNSRAYREDVLHQGMPAWKIVMIVINCILGALLVLWEVVMIRKYLNTQKNK